MVTLNEAEQLLDRLLHKSLAIQPSHCVCVRNRHASCSACIDVCPTQALHIENNKLDYNPNNCIECGCCANVCPTQALQSTALPLMPFAQMLHSFAGLSDKPTAVWICCQQHALAREDLEHLIVVPCLAHLDEAHYLLAAYYHTNLHLLHPDCSTCSKNSAQEVIAESLASAQTLAKQSNLVFSYENHCEQTRYETSYPLDLDKGGYSRRGFFTNMGNSLKHLGMSVAETTLESNSSPTQAPPTLAEQLTVAPGVLETFMPNRITVLLNILYDARNEGSSNNDPTFTTRLWGRVTIDNSCRNCGMCARFCPTGALVHKGNEPKPAMLFSSNTKKTNPQGPDHEFRCSECIQCRLCEDICPSKALHVDNRLSSDELLRFEPEIIKRPETEQQKQES